MFEEDSWLSNFDDSWSEILDILSKRGYKLTSNGILLSKKIYEQTGLLVYPIICRTYASRNMLKQGAFSWTMYQKNGKEVGSIDTVRFCLLKSVSFSVDTSWGDIEIYAERKEKS